MERLPHLDLEKVVRCFEAYMDHQGVWVSRAEFEANLVRKLEVVDFVADLRPLLASQVAGDEVEFDGRQAGRSVLQGLVSLLPGEAWKGEWG